MVAGFRTAVSDSEWHRPICQGRISVPAGAVVAQWYLVISRKTRCFKKAYESPIHLNGNTYNVSHF